MPRFALCFHVPRPSASPACWRASPRTRDRVPQTHLPLHPRPRRRRAAGRGRKPGDHNGRVLLPAASTAHTGARAVGLGPREEGHHIGAITWVTHISAGARRAHRQAGFGSWQMSGTSCGSGSRRGTEQVWEQPRERLRCGEPGLLAHGGRQQCRSCAQAGGARRCGGAPLGVSPVMPPTPRAGDGVAAASSLFVRRAPVLRVRASGPGCGFNKGSFELSPHPVTVTDPAPRQTLRPAEPALPVRGFATAQGSRGSCPLPASVSDKQSHPGCLVLLSGRTLSCCHRKALVGMENVSNFPQK